MRSLKSFDPTLEFTGLSEREFMAIFPQFHGTFSIGSSKLTRFSPRPGCVASSIMIPQHDGCGSQRGSTVRREPSFCVFLRVET